MQEKAIISDRQLLGGTPVFAGTRVPVQALLDYLRSGETLDDFLIDFPSVDRGLIAQALEEMEHAAPHAPTH